MLIVSFVEIIAHKKHLVFEKLLTFLSTFILKLVVVNTVCDRNLIAFYIIINYIISTFEQTVFTATVYTFKNIFHLNQEVLIVWHI